MILENIFEITKEGLSLRDNPLFRKFIANNIGKVVSVSIKEYKPRRNVEQNAKLWAIYQDIAAQLSNISGDVYTSHHIHMHNKQHLMSEEVTTFHIGDKLCYFLDSSSTKIMSRKDFSDMLDRLIVYYSGLGLKFLDDDL